MMQDCSKGQNCGVGLLALCSCSLESQSNPVRLGQLFTDLESSGAGHLHRTAQVPSQPQEEGSSSLLCLPAVWTVVI